MQAARLLPDAKSVILEDVPKPILRFGAAIVRVNSVFMSPFIASLIDGTSGTDTPVRPFTPGMDAIGTIEALDSNATDLKIGDVVYCDSYLESAQADGKGAMAFAGCFEMSSGADKLLAEWPNGSLATHMTLPVECLTRVGPAMSCYSVETLCRLSWLGTAHSAYEKSGFKPGMSVAVLGASGLLGSSAVMLGLALGASRVIAVGRSLDKLGPLKVLDSRVELATSPPSSSAPVDLVINAMAVGDPKIIEQAFAGLGRYGTLVILASPSSAPQVAATVFRDLTLRGSLWFPRATPSRLVALIAAGLLKLDHIKTMVFPLAEIDKALIACAHTKNVFDQVVIRP